jgi:hypothetical protein
MLRSVRGRCTRVRLVRGYKQPSGLIRINAGSAFWCFSCCAKKSFSAEADVNELKNYWCIFAASLAAVLFLAGVLFVRDPGSTGQFASNYFAAGQFARGVFASGEFAAGIFAAGTFAIGVFSIGIFSIGIFSAGLFSIGLYGIGLFVLAKYRKPLRIESGSKGQAGGN